MLIEIRSDVFRQGPVPFHRGFNVVIGDENATNSIGKSTLLMVVDFAFGGSSLLEHNKDLVPELGHHYYFFSFDFAGEIYRFRRGTNDQELVYRCADDFTPETALNLEGYTAFLKSAYEIGLEDISFRALTGLYMRIWGKENLDVHHPLHTVRQQAASTCVNNLLKTFDKFGEIRGLTDLLKAKESERDALQDAFKSNIVPKIGKREYRKNEERIDQIELEIDEIKSELAKFATNISELANREVLELKIQKDDLLAQKLVVESRLARIGSNLANNRHVKSAHFASLAKFFPTIDLDRLAEVEEFHSKLVGLLRSELRTSERDLRAQLERLTREIAQIDQRMTGALKSIDQPTIIVDRVYGLANDLNVARQENGFFETAERFKEVVREIKVRLSSEKEAVLDLVERQINDEMRRIVSLVFGEDRKSPRLTLKENSYTFEVNEDTGTGTAYAGLVVFDLAVFSLARLPAIVHDSILFKNIETDSVAKLFKVYAGNRKQSFIAIDEIGKYGQETVDLLEANSVLHLSNDTVLYIKDWRRKP